ncbi:MAG: hypothetical protein ACI4HM_08250 [Ruminococcus sp.]
MDFVSYALENMSTFDLITYILRALGWLLVKGGVLLCNTCEKLFNNVFSLLGFAYSGKITSYIQTKLLPYIAILVAISILILGYNLIVKSDDKERKKKITNFTENFFLMIIVLIGIPYLMTGHTMLDTQKADYSNGSISYKNTTNTFLINTIRGNLLDDDRTNDGVLSALRYKDNNLSTAETTVNDYLTDWQYMYRNYGKYAGDNTFQDKIVGSDNFTTCQFNAENGTNAVSSVNYIKSINEDIDEDTFNDKYDDDDNTFDGISGGTESSDGEKIIYTTKDSDNENIKIVADKDMSVSEYLFRQTHYKERLVVSDKAIDNIFNVITNPSLKTLEKSNSVNAISYWSYEDIDSFFDFVEETPYRYTVDWLPLFVTLIALILVFFILSYKTAVMIWNLAYYHILAVIFSAGDLAGGQKIREIVKSIGSIFLTIIFMFVDLQVFLIGKDYLHSAVNVSTMGSLTESIILLFFALACINAPNLLIKLFGIEGAGGSRAVGFMAMRMAERAGHSLSNMAKGAVGMGAGLAGYAVGKGEAMADSVRSNLGGFMDSTNNGYAGNSENMGLPDNAEVDNNNNELPESTGGVGGYDGNAETSEGSVDSDSVESGVGGYSEDTAETSEGSVDSDSIESGVGGYSEGNAGTETGTTETGENGRTGNSQGEQKVPAPDEGDVAYAGSIYDQCKDLGMSDTEASQTLDDIASGNSDNAFDRIGQYIDYDKATSPVEKGGLGYSDDKLRKLMNSEGSNKALGKEYAQQMADKAKSKATKAKFDSQSPYRNNTASESSMGYDNRDYANNRSSSLVGNSVGTSRSYNGNTVNTGNVGNTGNTGISGRDSMTRMTNALYGKSLATVFAPNISRRYRFGKEAGYAHESRRCAKIQSRLSPSMDSNDNLNRSFAVYSAVNRARNNGNQNQGRSNLF